MNRLEGKVCIVTGGGSREEGTSNGQAVAMQFAREGASVVINDRDESAARHTSDAIAAEGGNASIFVGDLTLAADAESLVEHAESTWGRLDVLHNNIGISGNGTILEATEELWDRVMDVNVKTMVLASKFAIPALERAGGGSIITISSISALRPRGLTPYSTSKGAVIALSQAMAVDHAAARIRVNCIVPGPVYTPLVALKGMTPERRERRRLASPLQLEGNAWDIAHAAVYFASDESRWVTGVVMPVDGGVSLTSPPR